MHVHHRCYLPGKDPWDYDLGALVTLCESCHTEEMEMQSEVDHRLLRALRAKFFYSELIGIAEAIEEMPLLDVPENVAAVYEWALSNSEVQTTLIKMYGEVQKKRYDAWKNKGTL